MVGFHRFIEIVGPLILEGQDVEEHRVAPVDDAFGCKGFLGFCVVENKGFVAQLDCGRGHEVMKMIW